MGNRSVIPFGPQHPVLPEPIQLKIELEDENVVKVLPALGYVHRGIERQGERNDFKQNVFLVERVCGICSSMHAMAYCMAVEAAMGIEVPMRAEYLRVIWSELHRIHSHLLWLGLLSEAFGFESLFMQLWRIREGIMDVLEKTAGNRVIISVCEIGGTRRDISPEGMSEILKAVDVCQNELDKVLGTLMNDYTVKKRTVGKGAIPAAQAFELGAVGPTARGSGIAQDLRMTGYSAYKELAFEPIVEPNGDTYSRAMVRARETYQSFDLVRQAVKQIPAGAIATKVSGRPQGRGAARVEAPRGELIYFVAGNGTKNLERMRLRVPTFANIPMLLAILPGLEFADVPVVTLSIDPCISCTER